MQLDSYNCELCILQKVEKVSHLFFGCNFAKRCWNTIGISYTSTRTPQQIIRQVRNRLGLPFAMEIILLMTWSIWKMRNAWMFNNEDPTVERCKLTFIQEFSMLRHRAKPRHLPMMEVWEQSQDTYP
uniref:Reverse transcriptase zinc-binding domain-containing protein n=1 Tax=Setaria viridis TaxID=4556 RepID=A0A4U6TJZ2_SETVI|nr:hypothetical protein SEVIR_7G037600v2 [Setaria viridis]